MPIALPPDDPIVGVTFDGLGPHDVGLAQGRAFEACTFRDCDWSGASLSNASFLDCTFEHSDGSRTDLTNARFRGTTFASCRLQGVDFGRLSRDPLGLEIGFDACDLAYSSFVDLDLRRCAWGASNLVGAVFERCDLREVHLGANLQDARFAKADLRGADLRRATNYRVDPEHNRLTGMRVSLPEALALSADFGVRLES